MCAKAAAAKLVTLAYDADQADVTTGSGATLGVLTSLGSGETLTTAAIDVILIGPHSFGTDDDDVMNGSSSGEYLFGATFNPDGSLAAGSGNDAINGNEGNDRIWGGDDIDILNGDAGNDFVFGGAGSDALTGGDGDDFLFGGDFSAEGARAAGSGEDNLNGGAGNDAIYGFDGDDLIIAGAGRDYVEGGEGKDVIEGGAGADVILGQDDDDTISGGSGFDYLFGGQGADTFLFNKGDSYDVIWDIDYGRPGTLVDKIILDAAFGIRTQEQLDAHVSHYFFDGSRYTVITFADSLDQLTIANSEGILQLTMTDRGAELVLGGIAFIQ